MNRKTALIIFIVATLVRLVYLAAVYDGPASLQHPDSQMYLDMAETFRETGILGTTYDGVVSKSAERAPGYIYFLAGLQSLVGVNLLYIVIVQALIDALVCVLVGVLAGYFHPRLLLPAGLIAAFNANMIIHGVAILTDNIFLLPFVGGLVASAAYMRKPSLVLAVGVGGLFAATLLVRPVLYYFPPFLLLFFAIVAWRHRVGFLRASAHMAAIVSCFVMVLAPFLVKNHQDYGHYDYVSQTGTHVLFWVYPQTQEYANGVPREVSVTEMLARLDAYRATLEAPADQTNPFAQSAEMKKVAVSALWGLGPYTLAKAWAVGAAINVAAPAIISSPVVRNMERPSFTNTIGVNPIEKVHNYLSSNTKFTSVMVPAILLTALARVIAGLSLLQLWPRKTTSASYEPKRTLDPLLTLFLLMVGVYIFAVTGPVTGAKYRMALEPALDIFLAAGLLWIGDHWRRYRQSGQA